MKTTHLNPSKLCILALVVAAAFLIPVGTLVASTVRFDNQSGRPALVKLVGPKASSVSVENGKKESVTVAPGHYFIKVRYGTPANYSYSKGNEFNVTETSTTTSDITITLHKVVVGNYGSKSISEAEFGRDEPGQAVSQSRPALRNITLAQPSPSAGETASQQRTKKYSKMLTEEVRQLFKDIVQNHRVPLPDHNFANEQPFWEFPKTFMAEGVRLDAGNYVIFVMLAGVEFLWMDRENLPELLSKKAKGGRVKFIRRGVLISTLDLEVLRNHVLSVEPGTLEFLRQVTDLGEAPKETTEFRQAVSSFFGSGQWKKETGAIAKGGYFFYESQEGILLLRQLRNEGNKPYRMIAFPKPKTAELNTFGFSVRLAPSLGGNTILLELADELIELK